MPPLELKPTWEAPAVPAGALVRATMPVPRRKPLAPNGTGGAFVLDDGANAGSGTVSLTGSFASVELNGLRITVPDGVYDDAIKLACSTSYLAIRRSRLDGIKGTHGGKHGDGVQRMVEGDLGYVLIEDTTILSAYQALMMSSTPGGRGIKTLHLRRVNVRDILALRKEESIAYYLGDPDRSYGPNTAPYTIILEDVYGGDWNPDKLLITPKGANIIGSVIPGHPPGGDFCSA